jgi:23S rRNA pseudouridine1911/1915/1917 synthase
MPARDRRRSRDTGGAFHVDETLAGKTLADAVRRAAGVSWGEAERRILGRLVAVHGNACFDPARRLKRGDVVNLLDHAAAKPPEAGDLDVLFQDRHLAVIDKPAGLVSVREPRERGVSDRRRERQPTLDELLARRLRRPQDLHRGKTIFPVHRLDRDTSGVMVFARTPDAERTLSRMFQAHDLKRQYVAVVRGRLDGPRTFDTMMVRDRGDGRRGSLPAGDDHADAKRAITRVRPLEATPGRTVVSCELETGRTHQIRIHLSEAGLPVCGDKTYGDRHEPNPPPRQALHAATLAFAHPTTGKPLRFEARWPNDLRSWLAKR